VPRQTWELILDSLEGEIYIRALPSVNPSDHLFVSFRSARSNFSWSLTTGIGWPNQARRKRQCSQSQPIQGNVTPHKRIHASKKYRLSNMMSRSVKARGSQSCLAQNLTNIKSKFKDTGKVQDQPMTPQSTRDDAYVYVEHRGNEEYIKGQQNLMLIFPGRLNWDFPLCPCFVIGSTITKVLWGPPTLSILLMQPLGLVSQRLLESPLHTFPYFVSQ
jgi:hypothetical protein